MDRGQRGEEKGDEKAAFTGFFIFSLKPGGNCDEKEGRPYVFSRRRNIARAHRYRS
jgi:hypothetical protein